MSKEWAGLTDPYTGHGYYHGQNTGFPVSRELAALRKERAALAGGQQDIQSLNAEDTRRAIGLVSPYAVNGASKGAKPVDGHIRADIHVHGGAHKAVVKTRGMVEASLHRWPKMEMG
jgi:hypothetical protein